MYFMTSASATNNKINNTVSVICNTPFTRVLEQTATVPITSIIIAYNNTLNKYKYAQ